MSTPHQAVDAERPAHDVDQAPARALFDAILRRFDGRLSLFVLRGWLEPLAPVHLEEGVLTLAAPSAFHRDWVRDHYQSEMAELAAELRGVPIAIALIHDAEATQAADRATERAEQATRPPAPVVQLPKPTARASLHRPPAHLPAGGRSDNNGVRDRLNPSNTFERFVMGPSNKMAYAACCAVAEAPGQRYSPLFLFGGVGLGKTHLLHAIGNEARRRNPDLRVVYMSAEEWVNEYIREIRERRFDNFRRRYRGGCDLLLIDDIQFLAGKDASQDEFFHTFNSLHESRRQIVVSSDRYPHEIEGLEDRLKTRLSWGLIADIQRPELETRVAILQRKADALGITLPEDVAHYLADHVVSSVRELEGALVRLGAYAQLCNEPLRLSLAKEQLRPMLGARSEGVTMERIIKVVSSYYDQRPGDLRGKSRQRQLTLARQVAMYLTRKHTQLSLPEIGRGFGGRDHTTVMSSVRKIAGLVATDAGMQATIVRLDTSLT